LSGSGWYETDFKSGAKKNLTGDAGKPSDKGQSDGKKDGGKKASTDTATAPKPKSDSKATG
jgi:hypothetical protein